MRKACCDLLTDSVSERWPGLGIGHINEDEYDAVEYRVLKRALQCNRSQLRLPHLEVRSAYRSKQSEPDYDGHART